MAGVPHTQQCCPLGGSGSAAVATHGGRAGMEEPWDAAIALFALPAAGEWQKSGLKLLRENTQELPQPQCSETEWSISRKQQTVVFHVTSDVPVVCEGKRAGFLQHLSRMLWQGLRK